MFFMEQFFRPVGDDMSVTGIIAKWPLPLLLRSQRLLLLRFLHCGVLEQGSIAAHTSGGNLACKLPPAFRDIVHIFPDTLECFLQMFDVGRI
jgi:hypothetical protein